MKEKDRFTKAAEKFATKYPEYEGELYILDRTTREDRRFLVSKGRICRPRYSRKWKTFSGGCQVCGRIVFEPVLKRALIPDPAAGQPLTEDEIERFRGRHRQQKSYVHDDWIALGAACPDCVQEKHLEPESEHRYLHYYGYKFEGEVVRTYRFVEIPARQLQLQRIAVKEPADN